MKIDLNSGFWADSTLDKIEIEYDKITLKIFEDVRQKVIYINCIGCLGITQLITWDETVIKNITANKITDASHTVIAETVNLYGQAYSAKPIEGDFYNIKVSLIDNSSFEIICKDFSVSDE